MSVWSDFIVSLQPVAVPHVVCVHKLWEMRGRRCEGRGYDTSLERGRVWGFQQETSELPSSKDAGFLPFWRNLVPGVRTYCSL